MFRNKVDDFFIRYLQKEFIIAEVFAVKGSGNMVTEKIGEAKLPLVNILMENRDENSHAQQHYQEIKCVATDGSENVFTIGKIKYSTKMKKPLGEALKYVEKKLNIS